MGAERTRAPASLVQSPRAAWTAVARKASSKSPSALQVGPPTAGPAAELAKQQWPTRESHSTFGAGACGCGLAVPAGARLVVGAPDSPAEREADRAAALASSDAPVRPAIRPASQGRRMQLVPSGGGPADPGPDFASRLEAMRGAGSPLPEDQRVYMERSFGRAFGGVRLHTDASAAAAALAVQAHAFTAGNDIFFAHGRFAPATPAGRRLLAHELAHVAQQRDVVQRKCASCTDEDEVLQRQPMTQVEPTVTGGARRPAIVDDAAQVGPGQMTRVAFMAELRASVTAMCNQELAAVGRTADGCPYLQRWLDYYQTRPADALMRAVHLYAGSAGDADAGGLLELVRGRVRSAVRVWIAGGGITGVPQGADLMPPGARAEPGAAVQTKRLPGTAAGGVNETAALQAQLGPGQPLDAAVRSRMERSFGGSFSQVRVHTDPAAALMNSGLSSRAFTIGNDVAFASGEYRPGTLVGDLLLAHELAHTRQQGGGTISSAPSGAMEHGAERAADRAALATLLGKRAAVPVGRGLRLQRCFVAAPAAEGAAELLIAEEVVAATAPEVIAATAPEVVAATAPEVATATGGTAVTAGKVAVTVGTGGVLLGGDTVPQAEPKTDPKADPKTTVEPVPPTKPPDEERRRRTCVPDHIDRVLCSTLVNYRWSGIDLSTARAAALKGVKDAILVPGNFRLSPTILPGESHDPAKVGPCVGKGGTHTIVRDSGPARTYGSIACCPCCTDSDKGPLLSAKCGFVPKPSYQKYFHL